MAEVALEVASIRGIGRGPGFALAPFEQTVGDYAIAVLLTEKPVNVFAVEAWSCFATAILEVVRDAAGSGEGALAEWTGDLLPLMDPRV